MTEKLDIILATRNRWDKLLRMLASVPREPWCLVRVIFDDDPKSANRMVDLLQKKAENLPHLEVYASTTHIGSVAARNVIAPLVEDALLYAVDDIEFLPGAIPTAFELLREKFPDDDGVVGMRYREDHHPTSTAILGRAFLARYPGKMPFFPGYWHFAAQEVKWLADVVGRFHYPEKVFITHNHPSIYPKYVDRTHIEAREQKGADIKLKKERMAHNLIWGQAQ